MNAEFRQAISKPVIRLEDVSALRAHIEQRHPDQDSHMRAEMMAEGINRMLDSAMTGLESVHKENIKKKLIAEQLIGGRQSILKLDVLNRILALDIKPDQLMAKTWGWYVLNTGHSVTLSDFLEQASPYLPHRVREAVRDNELRNLEYQSAGRQGGATAPSDSAPAQTAAASEADRFSGLSEGLGTLQQRFKRATAYRLTRKGLMAIWGIAGVLVLGAALPQLSQLLPEKQEEAYQTSPLFKPPLEYKPAAGVYDLTLTPLDKPHYLRYQNVSIEKLKAYLERKDSMLLSKDYLDQLLDYSCEKDLNPLLLIAIIGQEQNYVPSVHKFAPQMIENPFNIYGSWETHPVGFTASMKEACYTINTALLDRPLYTDPFEVINSRYAQDPRWYLGVKVIFRDLMALAGDY